jgi:DNA-binding NtrC family response regulator
MPKTTTAADAHRPPPDDAMPDIEAEFRDLVQSPLRADLLRHLHAHPDQWFDAHALMTASGNMRYDVAACMTRLVAFGVARASEGVPGAYAATWPTRSATAALLRAFLDTDRGADAEDRSEAARRFRRTVARDEKMLVVLEWIRTAAKSDLPVLILGPAGADLRAGARMIHDLGCRASEPFRAIACATLPAAIDGPDAFGLGEAEAGTGTLLLDQVDALAPAAQDALVDALAARTGGDGSARIVSTATEPLDTLARLGAFREALHRALSGFTIRVPGLAERPADIPVVAERLLVARTVALGLAAGSRTWSAGALARLRAHAWPGDVDELEQTVAHAASTSDGVIGEQHLNLSPAPVTRGPDSVLATLRDAERAHVTRVLDAVGWNKKEAARVLDISRGTLYRKIQDYGLAPRPAAPPLAAGEPRRGRAGTGLAG